MFEKLDRFVTIFSLTVMTVCMSVATIVAFFNVILRYAFGASLSWAGALTSYLFIWSALFGAAYGFRTGVHIGVTFLYKLFSPKVGKVFLSISLVIILVYLLLFSKLGIDFIRFSINLEQIDVDLRIPFWIVYLSVPISLVISSYQVFLKCIKVIKTPSPEFDYDKLMNEE